MSQIKVQKRTPRYWTATFDNGPVNLMAPDTVYELDELLTSLETDPGVRVMVFDGASSDFFIARWDATRSRDVLAGMKTESATRRGMHPLRRHADQAGSSACSHDRLGSWAGTRCRQRVRPGLRHPARPPERAVSGSSRSGSVPWQAGPGRAFEALLSSDDFPAELAERCGWSTALCPTRNSTRSLTPSPAGLPSREQAGARWSARDCDQAPVRDPGPGSGVCAASWPGVCSGLCERERTAGARRPGASREAAGLRTTTAETTASSASTITTAP